MNWTLCAFCLAMMFVAIFADADTAKSMGATAWFLLAMIALRPPSTTTNAK